MARTSPADSVPEVAPESVLRNAGEPGTDVAIPATRFSDDDLLAISSLDDVRTLLAANEIPLVAADQVLGNGFSIVNDKGFLCGVPMILLGWSFNRGDNGEFVSVNAVANLPGNTMGKFIINDGGSGIYAQLRKYTERTGKAAGLYVARGLRRSDYTYDDGSGVPKQATTFYLDTSA